jgi:hypothetical protein
VLVIGRHVGGGREDPAQVGVQLVDLREGGGAVREQPLPDRCPVHLDQARPRWLR